MVTWGRGHVAAGREAVGASALLNSGSRSLAVGQFQSSKKGCLKRRLMFQIADNSVIDQHAGESRSAKALNITFWILQGLLAAALLAGTTKLAGSQMQVTFFEKIGLGQWFRYFTGGLGDRRYSRACGGCGRGGLLGMTMVGAVNIHLLITGGSPVPSVVLLVIAVAITWYRELYLKSANNNPSKLVDNSNRHSVYLFEFSSANNWTATNVCLLQVSWGRRICVAE